MSSTGNCLPWWHTRFASLSANARTVRSGCKPVDGYVECDPAAMAAAASRTIGRHVSLDQYTLARNVASEQGSGTPEEKMLVAMAAIGRSRMRGQSVHRLLACTNKRGVCRYGPINVVVQDPETGEKVTGPYGRWASTSQDPGTDDLEIAAFALSGQANDFIPGASDQARIDIISPEKIVRFAKGHEFWVGFVPGVDHRRTFGFKHLPSVEWDSPFGQALITAATTALSQKSPDWSGLPACKPLGRGRVIAAAFGAVLVGGAIGTAIAYAARNATRG